ncbi:MAG: type II toxin-antitoxin system YafQ family toxin [Oscillospiraceae bacterium]|nr:type II toxin-antitoxin system YafQ family toxin [Oscillospiraceae bacterium]
MNKYTPEYSAEFKKNRKLLIKRGYNMLKLEKTIDLLLSGKPMPAKYRDHQLKGKLKDYRECHVDGAGDWLLMYRKYKDNLILVLIKTGTHDDLFE